MPDVPLAFLLVMLLLVVEGLARMPDVPLAILGVIILVILVVILLIIFLGLLVICLPPYTPLPHVKGLARMPDSHTRFAGEMPAHSPTRAEVLRAMSGPTLLSWEVV